MALVVLLRGVNVGGNRVFRPAAFVKGLKHLDAVNIGAAGTFVIRKSEPVAQVRAEFAKRLPFVTEIVICPGRDVLGLLAEHPYTSEHEKPDIVRFVSVMSGKPGAAPKLPLSLPPAGQWLLRILATRDRMVFGAYRRHMKTIAYLGTLDKHFGVPVTTRNWNTITAIAKVLAKP